MENSAVVRLAPWWKEAAPGPSKNPRRASTAKTTFFWHFSALATNGRKLLVAVENGPAWGIEKRMQGGPKMGRNGLAKLSLCALKTAQNMDDFRLF